jgi:hypothetical protein
MNVSVVNYKMNPYRNLWRLVMYSSVLYICPLYFLFRFGRESVLWGIVSGVIGFSILFIPHVVLHVMYVLNDHGTRVKVCGKQWQIISKPKQPNRGRDIISSDMVVRVVAYKPYAQAKGSSIKWYPWDDYSCYALELVDGHVSVVTCLTIPDDCEVFSNCDVHVIPRFICWPFHGVPPQVNQ